MASKLRPKSQRVKAGKARRAKRTLVARDGYVRTMTLAEIYRKYPDQWVLIAEARLTKDLDVIEGKVVAHSKEVDDIYKKLRTGKYTPFALEFTGGIPANPAICF